MKKHFLGILIIPLFLSSCIYGGNNGPVKSPVNGNPQLEDIKNMEILGIKTEGLDEKSPITEEINDREKGFSKLNKNKQYLNKVQSNLVISLNALKENIELTRKLELADVKIVKASIKGYLKENAINTNNYFYKYILKYKDDKVKKKNIISDIDGLLEILSDKNNFDKYYYINLDISKADNLNISSSKIYFYTNYYLKNVKYNKNIVNLLLRIDKFMEILKINKFQLSEKGNVLIKNGQNIFIYRSTIKSLLNDIKK